MSHRRVGVVSNHEDFGELAASYHVPFHHIPVTPGTKAAAETELLGDGRHFVSLDKAINTMGVTGRDMLDKYKETSRGGLAVNVIEC